MAEEQTDEGQEKEQEQTNTPASPPPSDTDWEAQAKHFQSIADKRDAEHKSLKAELDALKADQEAANKKELEEKEEFQKLYQQEQTKLAAKEAEFGKLNLQVKLQSHLAEKAPDYVGDFKWIAPHVDSEEAIASVVEDYTKAHPKAPATGGASMGNRSKDGKTLIQVSKADLTNPVELARLRKEDPDFDKKLIAGEIDLI
jgi:flagellar biosynthesis GTPase FlhF